MKPRLPGLPAVSALMLATILTVWLGIWGPIDLSKLKEWQTSMAAAVALLAATLAYKGATAKVDFDREEAERERTDAKLGLYLQLRTQLVRIAGECYQANRMIDDLREVTDAKNIYAWYPRPFADANEIDEAWNKLFLFPREAYEEIQKMREGVATVCRLLTDAIRQLEEKHTVDDARSAYTCNELQELEATSRRLLIILDNSLLRLKRFD
jgi:hypothetical protein